MGRDRGARLIEEYAGPRTRTVDEHMCTVERSTFRLQLFTGAQVRPVAVLTQTIAEGQSLTNGAERFVEAVWQRYCPAETEPPLVIAHQFLSDDRDCGFQWFGFTATGRYTVASPPRWGPTLTTDLLDRLLGATVDPDRGYGYIPSAPVYEGRMVLAETATALLPSPDLEGTTACMPGVLNWWRRFGNRLSPQHDSWNCCWYHGGDWHAASAAAAQALAAAGPAPDAYPAAGADVEESDPRTDPALDLLDAAQLAPWTRDAAQTLLRDPIQVERDDDGRRYYVNGRHRARAMLDAGVRRTVVGRWYDGDLADRTR